MADARTVKPTRNKLVVLADPRPSTTGSGLIILPDETGFEKVSEGSGLVIAVGPGPKNEALGLAPGQKIVFRGYLKHAYPLATQERWENGEEKQFFIMESQDVELVVPAEVDVHVFGGRPMVPEYDKELGLLA